MRLFLDTASIEVINKWVETGVVNGITTNPSHLAKEGGDPTSQVKKICELMKPYGDVSVEVTEVDPANIYKQAHEIAKLSDNIVVKVPCAHQYYITIKRLVEDGLKINATLVFSLEQSLMMAKLNVHYISPFIGRLDDIGTDGQVLIEEIRTMLNVYGYESKLLAASIRTVGHVHGVLLSGADIATLPVGVFEKMMEHPLTVKGMKLFNDDWRKLNISKFPA